MIISHPFAPLPSCTALTCSKPFYHNSPFIKSSIPPFLLLRNVTTPTLLCSGATSRRSENSNDIGFDIDINEEDKVDESNDYGGLSAKEMEMKDVIDIQEGQEYDGDSRKYSSGGPDKGGDEKDFDRNPEFAEILGGYLDDPEKAQSKMEDRLRKNRNKILHTKTGSGVPMKVSFNKFEYSNSYIWFEFYNAPLAKDVSLICDSIRAWHIIGRLGGCNAMNMQLSQSEIEKRPSYDYIQGANVTPTTFYNIGDLEVQDNLARIWVDIGTNEPLILDVLINALTQISSDFVGIKQVVFGGEEFESWKEDLKSEDSGYGVHKI
ncbi:uncharacterized protein LOC131595753 [Vicia villosa]|uniref:uncharacterized protein LOC131595753 n=1 Tax=Vicia villosa TaxID=3911 RepID=UPI00273C18BC|nr:uncharacterized protein LOC131595753 [Vicia villosa]